jgi:hypothetical protein
MTTIRRQIIFFSVAAGCLLLGSALYFLFRPTTLLMFHWADLLGLTKSIGTMRTLTDGSDSYLPNWTIYSLPFALWVSSCLFFVSAIWSESTSCGHYAWFWCIPIIAITAELAQSLHVFPGHFDPVDLIMIICGTILGFVATELNQIIKGIKTP